MSNVPVSHSGRDECGELHHLPEFFGEELVDLRREWAEHMVFHIRRESIPFSRETYQDEPPIPEAFLGTCGWSHSETKPSPSKPGHTIWDHHDQWTFGWFIQVSSLQELMGIVNKYGPVRIERIWRMGDAELHGILILEGNGETPLH